MDTRYFDPLRILSAVGRRSDALRRSRAKSKQYAHAQAWIGRAEKPLKINVGCGNQPFDGWTNMDADPTTKADILGMSPTACRSQTILALSSIASIFSSTFPFKMACDF